MVAPRASFARPAATVAALLAGLAFSAANACGGQSVVQDGAAGAGGNATTSTATSSGTDSYTSTSPSCPPASSPGCCYGDGGCCSCVAKVCGDWASGDDPGVPELTTCVCKPAVCAEACKAACAANGIDKECLPCVEEAVKDVCAEQYLLCSG